MRRPLAFVTLLATLALPPLAAEPCDRYGFTEHRVETEPGIELFVREGGEGSPAVLVPGDFLLFDHLCSLAESHRVVFYDMRNRGRSSRVTEGDRLTLEGDVRDLEAIRRRFGLERPALVGYSYLGKMIVRYALDHPASVSRLVQLGPVPMDPQRTFPPALVEPSLVASGALDDEIRELRARRAEGFHEENPQAYCELEWEISRLGLVGDPANADSLASRCELPNEWPKNLVFHMQHHFLGSMLHAVVNPLEAATLHVPVLTIHGTKDRNAPYGSGREWAASLPGARLLTLENVGHAIHAEIELAQVLDSFLAGVWPDGAETVHAGADGQRSQLQAWDLLRNALAIHAPEGLPEDRGLRVSWTGELRPRSQSRTAEPPFDPPFPVRQEVTIGPDRTRLAFDEELQWPDFLSRWRSVVTPDDAFDQNLDSGAASAPYREPAELLSRTIRLVPPLLLDEILADSAGSLRVEGVTALADEPVLVVSCIHRGERIDLHLSAEGSLAGYSRMVEEPMLGDARETLRFEGARSAAGLRLPERITRSLAGVGPTSDLALTDAAWTDLDPTLLERPEDGAGSREATGRAPEGIEELAGGIFLAPIPGSPDYWSLVVEREDHLVLVEAPVGEEATSRLLESIAERFPGKPIRWVVATHHHFDHSGGVPTALAGGATLITTSGNVTFFRRAVIGPHTLAGGGAPDPPTIQVVEDTWSVPGGPPTVEVLRVEPTDHAAEMLVVHVPEASLLFQGDLVRFPLPDGEPRRPQVEALRRLLENRLPGITRIAGVHGEVGTKEDLEEPP